MESMLLDNLIKEGKEFSFENNSHYKASKFDEGFLDRELPSVSIRGKYVSRASEQLISWNFRVQDFIFQKYGANHFLYERYLNVKASGLNGHTQSGFESALATLRGLLDSCRQITPPLQLVSFSGEFFLTIIFDKFHEVVRSLRGRYDGRTTIDVNDEYDVQDLLHALLRLYFEDVRKEEWTPSYAGGSARMDFLLKNERVVIEVKKTRNTLSDKELGNQLIIDKEKYKQHPDCSQLLCFVYDPEGRIANPRGLENDLNSEEGDSFKVKVIIRP